MQERFFPIGIQTFEKIRESNAIYVDKTGIIYRLVKTCCYVFLARPRRFGKSLLVSTLKAYFEERKELFDGLAIAQLEKDWIQYPVLHFPLSLKRVASVEDVSNLLDSLLRDYEKIYGTESGTAKSQYGIRLKDLVFRANAQTGKKVVLLFDEYDAPILDTMHDKKLMESVRQQLRDFYSPIKDLDSKLQFVFITGISKFSQLSIFSELNNLTTISMNSEYAAICGFTRDEIVTQLAPEVENFAGAMDISVNTALLRLKRKYDGYHFTKKSPDIYNPFSLLNSLKDKELYNYWFSTGTPTHLTKLLSQYTLRPEELEGFAAGEMDFYVPLEQAETPIPVLYQSGYLTIKSFRSEIYTLGFPNEEVRVSFLKGLAPYYTGQTATGNNSFLIRLMTSLNDGDVDRAMTLLRSFFSSIPYNAEKQDEDHYKTIFYLIFTLASEYSVRTEQCSAAGRCDALIETEDTIYVFEFKLDGTAEEALKQIDDKGYAIQYEAGDKKIVKVGVNFENDKRTIERWVVG
ncbi:MAG: ATP-binding protein [Proteobacteria bacterium]|nr:ATP-binding protein [Pseudomonadota bacterium]